MLDIIQNGPIISTVQQVELMQQIEYGDVKKAMFSIGNTKSPGPDGYGSSLYKSAWNIMGKDISEAILEFFQNGKLLRQINSTIIALIPKMDKSEYAIQYRPISCGNVLYKCISKMICTRLKPVVNHLVAKNQEAFVQGR